MKHKTLQVYRKPVKPLPLIPKFANLTDNGGSIVLTYWPSEFSQIRGQYRYTDYAENRSANELLLQVIFSLGAHGAHPF